MKRIILASLLAIPFVAFAQNDSVTICPTCASTASVTTMTISPAPCGQLTSAFYCYGIPIVEGAEVGTLNLDPIYNGRYNNVYVSLDGIGLADVTAVTSTPTTLTINFASQQGAQTAYTGTIALTYKTYRGYRSGRGAGWFTGWTITGGTVTINY